MQTIDVWTDGSCIGNGKTGATSGIGVHYRDNPSRDVSTKLPIQRNTNNRAELCAIVWVLCTNPGTTNLNIHTDSRYAIDCITKYSDNWKRHGWRKSSGEAVEWVEIIQYILLVIKLRNEKGSTTEFIHVRGHSGDIQNDVADNLARKAAMSGKISNMALFMKHKCGVQFGEF